METFTFLGLSAIQSETLSVLLIIAACSAAYCFIVGEITRNNSQMDKLWSILPAVYVWVAAFKAGFAARLVLMAILATVWGARLTFNFALKGAYSWKFWTGEEDYRWPWLRKRKEFQPRWKWVVFDFLFISIYQNFLVLLTTLPAVAAIGSSEPFGWKDIVVGILMASFIAYEAVADRQQWRFQSTKWAMINSGRKLEELPAPYNKGFNTTGLWRVSRHPNYFGEISMWWGVWIMFASVNGLSNHLWYLVGPVAMTCLFLFISIPLMEKRQLQNKPGHAEYKKETRILI